MPNEPGPLDPRLAEAISALRNRAPATDLWPEIAPRLRLRRPKGSLLLGWPTALAAGIAIAFISAAGTLLVVRRDATVRTMEPVALISVAYTASDSTLEFAIRDLERSVRATMAQLDEPARLGIARGLTALDNAIANAAAQRLTTPDDPRAEHDLTSSLRRKLGMLRSVSALTTRQT